jgi:hypothetical protein
VIIKYVNDKVPKAWIRLESNNLNKSGFLLFTQLFIHSLSKYIEVLLLPISAVAYGNVNKTKCVLSCNLQSSVKRKTIK